MKHSPNNSCANFYLKFFLLAFVIVMFGVVSVSAVECGDSPVNGCTVTTTPSNWNNVNINFTSSLSIYQNLNIFNYSSLIIPLSRTWNLVNGTFTFNQSNLTFENPSSSPQITATTNNLTRMNFINAKIQGNYVTSFNIVSIPQNSSNLSIVNSNLIGLRRIIFNGLGGNILQISNSNISDFVTSFLEITDGDNTLIENSNFYNMSSGGSAEGIKIVRGSNQIINNVNVSLVANSGSGIYLSNTTNATVENSYISKTSGVCLATRDTSDFTYFINNTVEDCGSYGIDSLASSKNVFVENNTIKNASNGIAFSHEIVSYNFTSRNNRIYDDRSYGLTFNTVQSGSSYNDYINNSALRCLSVSDVTSNIYIENITCENSQLDGLVFGQSNNVEVNKATVLETEGYDFYFADSNNINIKEVSSEDTYLIRLSNATNISLFDFNSIDYYFLNNTHASLSSNLLIYNLTLALAYNTNGSLLCGGLATGNCNITLPAGNSSYVLDNFNLTESVSRENNPLWISSRTEFLSESQDTATYSIANNISEIDGVTFIANTKCLQTGDTVKFTSNSGVVTTPSYTCLDANTVSFTLDNVETSSNSNTLLITYNKEPQASSGGSSGGGTTEPTTNQTTNIIINETDCYLDINKTVLWNSYDLDTSIPIPKIYTSELTCDELENVKYFLDIGKEKDLYFYKGIKLYIPLIVFGFLIAGYFVQDTKRINRLMEKFSK